MDWTGRRPQGANTGHGHVFPRPDTVKARCGGPGICSECSADAMQKDGMKSDPLTLLTERVEKLEAAALRLRGMMNKVAEMLGVLPEV